jgi:hypothetical protein
VGTIFFKEENGSFVGVPQARSLPRSMLGSFASLGLWFESITLLGTIFFKEENGFFVGVPQARSLPRSMLGSFASLGLWFESIMLLGTIFLSHALRALRRGGARAPAASRPCEPIPGSSSNRP